MPPKAAAIRDDRIVSQKKQKQKPKDRPQPKKQSQTTPSVSVPQESAQYVVPPEIQQSILDVFTQAFPIMSQPTEFKRIMQEVKGHLYNRDFLAAFGKQEYLHVYASRWSAARALAYADIFAHPDHVVWYELHKRATESEIKQRNDVNDEEDSCGQSSQFANMQTWNTSIAHVKVVCIGGGAGAELVALAAINRYMHSRLDSIETNSNTLPSSLVTQCPLHVFAVDIADWSEPMRRLSSGLTQTPPVPAGSSEANDDVDCAVFNSGLNSHVVSAFRQQDILLESSRSMREMLQHATLITIMFTLNELFSASLPKTTAFLLNLTDSADVGTHLVVVDSPGSYSEIQIGKTTTSQNSPNTKQYPMKWLLDHTLLEVAGKDNHARWTKVEEHDSRWFRIDHRLNLQYGIDLENCRYQIHVFRKLR